jgi:hypothetical protein
MAITAVGSLVTTDTNSVTVSPVTIGDVLVLAFNNNPGAGNTAVTSISGGGVSTWSLLVRIVGSGSLAGCELWMGTVTTTGSSTVTVSAGLGVNYSTAVQEFHSSTAATWTADGVGNTAMGTASSGNLPSVTPAGSNELYVGMLGTGDGSVGGSSTGFTYQDWQFSQFGLNSVTQQGV